MRKSTGGLALALSFVVWATACGGGPRTPTSPTPLFPNPDTPISGGAGTLSGTVRDYAGKTLPGIKVSLGYSDPTVSPDSITSDQAGHYQFRVRGAVTVSAEAEGFYGDSHKLSVNADLIQDLELMPPIAIAAGQSVTADLHAGPHSSICRTIFELVGGESDPCRGVTVTTHQPGTLEATLEWSGPPGLALSERVSPFGFPVYGPTACCDPGLVLKVAVVQPGPLTLLVRLKDRTISPVTFTLRTSLVP